MNAGSALVSTSPRRLATSATAGASDLPIVKNSPSTASWIASNPSRTSRAVAMSLSENTLESCTDARLLFSLTDPSSISSDMSFHDLPKIASPAALRFTGSSMPCSVAIAFLRVASTSVVPSLALTTSTPHWVNASLLVPIAFSMKPTDLVNCSVLMPASLATSTHLDAASAVSPVLSLTLPIDNPSCSNCPTALTAAPPIAAAPAASPAGDRNAPAADETASPSPLVAALSLPVAPSASCTDDLRLLSPEVALSTLVSM